MGRPKLLLPWGNSTVIQTVLAAWQTSRVDHVLVVVRPDDSELAEVCRRAGATVVVPPESPPEMKRSIQLALHEIHRRHVPTDADAWLLAPADMPRLSTTIINRLIAEHAHASTDQLAEPAILLPIVGQDRGHPVLFPWPLARQVDQLGEREGVNALLDRNLVRRIAVDSIESFADIDTPEDYARLHAPQ